jgi:hypothetical protein
MVPQAGFWVIGQIPEWGARGDDSDTAHKAPT